MKVLHLAAEGDAYRQEVFKAAAKSICLSFFNGSINKDSAIHNEPSVHLVSLPTQLGVTREYLQKTAMKMYVV